MKGGNKVNGKKSETNDDDPGCTLLLVPKRYLVTVLAMLGLLNAYTMRVNMSVAIVSMVNNITKSKHGHAVETEHVAEFNWNPKLQGLILGSFFAGYIFTQIPGGFLASKYGGKNLFGGAILISGILTIFTPVVARESASLLIALRVLLGAVQGVLFPANHAMISRWAPVFERTKITAITTTGTSVGTVVAMSLSGVLVKSFGWPIAFYFFGVIAILWSFLWFSSVTNSPSEHPTIRWKERTYIEQSLGGESDNKNCRIPWTFILLSPAAWAIIIGTFSQLWQMDIFLTTLPTYIKNVLGYEITATGFLSSAPFLANATFLLLWACVSDFVLAKGLCSTTSVRKICACIGFFIQGTLTALIGYTTSQTTAELLLIFGFGVGGSLTWSGLSVNIIDISPRYAAFLMGISNCVATVPGIIGPPLAGALTPDETAGQWRYVFYISGGVSLLGCIAFGFLASGDKQEWNDHDYKVVPTSPIDTLD